MVFQENDKVVEELDSRKLPWGGKKQEMKFVKRCMFTRGRGSSLDTFSQHLGEWGCCIESSVHRQRAFSAAALCCKWVFIAYKIHRFKGNLMEPLWALLMCFSLRLILWEFITSPLTLETSNKERWKAAKISFDHTLIYVLCEVRKPCHHPSACRRNVKTLGGW